jgi:hypothetical protein
MGYVGDHGHQFKVWDPISMKIVESRDVGFPQYGGDDTDDNEHGDIPAFALRPLNPSGGGSGGGVASFQPSMLDNTQLAQPKPKSPEKLAIQPQQAPLITPSP